MTAALFVAGLGLLIFGAEILVRGASRLAADSGVSPLVIGLTIVAFGTSSPEMAVSVSTAHSGGSAIAVGNVVGSNIFNILLILGASATITPLIVSRQLVRLDVPIMIAASALCFLLGLDGSISRFDGALLLAGMAAYTALLFRLARRERGPGGAGDEFEREFGQREALNTRTVAINAGLIAAGLLLLVLGSRWLVDGAISMARALGVDEVVIGLTIVAAGTSLPEVATSIMASLRGERDIAVGNVVGSNIFNILAVLGTAALVAPDGLSVPHSINVFDGPVMLAVAIACLPIFLTGHTIARWEGAVFLAYYAAYTAYLVMNATDHAALPIFSEVMLLFVVPLTVLTLLVTLVRAVRKGTPLQRSG